MMPSLELLLTLVTMRGSGTDGEWVERNDGDEEGVPLQRSAEPNACVVAPPVW